MTNSRPIDDEQSINLKNLKNVVITLKDRCKLEKKIMIILFLNATKYQKYTEQIYVINMFISIEVI